MKFKIKNKQLKNIKTTAIIFLTVIFISILFKPIVNEGLAGKCSGKGIRLFETGNKKDLWVGITGDSGGSGGSSGAGGGGNVPADIKGFYAFGWTMKAASGPPNSNIGVTFTGWLPGDPQGDVQPDTNTSIKWLSYGGGNSNGAWTSAKIALLSTSTQLSKVKNLGYTGICFDIETGTGSVEEFDGVFKAVKGAGLTVMVTTSWGKPYNFSNGQELMEDFVKNPSIDILSPQLYQTGYETSIDWSQLENKDLITSCKPKLAPSVVVYTMFDQVKQNLPNAVGYFQWKQS